MFELDKAESQWIGMSPKTTNWWQCCWLQAVETDRRQGQILVSVYKVDCGMEKSRGAATYNLLRVPSD